MGRRTTPSAWHGRVACLVATAILAATGSLSLAGLREALGFAAEMAEIGNWHEARFRWEKAARERPEDPRLLNNLGVAYEALGEFDVAREHYDRAVATPGGNDPRIRDNLRQFERFRRRLSQGESAEDKGERNATPPASAAASAAGKASKQGKGTRVTVKLPVPPRMDTTGIETVLVTSFLTEDNSMLDINRELVRFIRSEYGKRSGLEVLDVSPPPAVPEQSLEDMIRNREFWKWLGREYGADLIVSGTVDFGRKDASGFQEVDTTSPTTGQTVRSSRFVEREQFGIGLELIFMDGAAGELLFRDRLQRSIIFNGSANDPLTAFFEMSESMGGDMLAIVKSRTREDTRFIFKK